MIYMVMHCLIFFQQGDSNGEMLKSFNWMSNSSKGCVVEVDLAYPKELRQWHKDYILAPDKIEIKGEMLSNYQLIIADFIQYSYW